jgi:hypothetical protein
VEGPAVAAVEVKYRDKVTFVGIAGLAPGADFGAFVDYTGTGELTQLNDESGSLWAQLGATGRSTFLFVNNDGTFSRTGYGQMDEAKLESQVKTLISS